MATAKREFVAKNLLDQRHPRKAGRRKPNHSARGHRHLVKLSEEELSRREQGWNDRFAIDPPPKSNKVPSPPHSPTFSTPATPLSKESRIQNERAQYGKRGGKRNRAPKKPSSGKLVPLSTLSKPPPEAAQPTKEEKLRFKVLKAIDARETLLYQLSALILCTPVQESLFIPSRPTEPPTVNNAGRQQMRSRGGMALAPAPLSRHSGNPGAMTNAREATKLAQQLATDLQVTGIQCVEALVEWMLEAGAQAETPPPFLWRGRNYFLKMFNDLDFAESELAARGVNLDCFKQQNPLLIRPNQKLGRVLAAHSIILEMIEFAKEMTPMELLALSGRMRDSDREETEADNGKTDSRTNSTAGLNAANDNNDPTVNIEKMQLNTINKQALERHDHESAADLVNLLDESLDFTRESASRDGDTKQTDATNACEDEHYNSNDASEEKSARPMTGRSLTDAVDNNLEPDDGDEPLGNGEADGPTDNQSDYGDNSMDDIDNNDEPCVPEASAPQLKSEISESPTEDTGDIVGPEQKHNDTPADEIVPDIEPEALGTTAEPGLGTEQHSPRSNTSDNQQENDNSFDAKAGGRNDDGMSEASDDVQQAEDTLAVSVSAAPETIVSDQTAPPENSTHDEAINRSASPEKLLTSRTEDTNGSEYDNSFDEDVDEEKTSTDVNADTRVTSPYSAIAPATIDNISRIQGMEPDKHLVASENDQPVPETDDPQAISKRLESELKRWTFLEDENRPTEVNAQSCLMWHSTRALKENLQRHSSISECMEGSIISMLDQYGLTVPETPMRSLLWSDVAQELDLASHLIEECQVVLDDICSVVAEAIQASLRLKNSLVSEIEIQEVLETAEAVRLEYHNSTWEFVKIASMLLVFLLGADNDALASFKDRSPISVGLSRLVKVFYPYLVNQPREELSDNWHPVSSVLAAMGLSTDHLYIMLDPMCKTILLAVKLCSWSNQESKDEGDLAIFPKVTVICDREDVLQSSVEYVRRTHFSSDKAISNFSLFPFFKCSFGEKLVDGVKVEEGEGKGPLKEWFTLVGSQLASKWKQVPLSNILADAYSTQVTASGNTITIPGASDMICPGFQVEWETSEGETIRRVINKRMEHDNFLLDRSVQYHSFVASQLRLSQPITAIFEYVQGSESYWLNETTRDSRENRNVLVFVGWFLASAVTHFSSIQLRIHPLFFHLLLNPQHCVTLEEIQSFDPQLFTSLSGMKDMKPLDFSQFLKFEGAHEGLSVEAYISNVLEEKFGPASGFGWQLQVIRGGFTRVIGIDQLSSVGITEADLVESICGSNGGPGDDFVINEVFRVAADTDFTGCRALMNAFWQTVNSFEPQLKRKFIKFVTGVDTLPLPGTEFLRIEMPFTAISSDDHKKCAQMLPQAHTCDNMLELPNYWKALCWREKHDEKEPNSKLEEELVLLLSKKLRDAVEYSSGYGLDGTSDVGGVRADKSKDYADQLAKEESYDSLGLPALAEGGNAADLPFEDTPPSPPRSDHDEAEQDEAAKPADELEAKPADSSETAMSPRPEDSYDDDYDDWEEESMA
ncbi:hypothetical protein F442_00716 [Phytophthora nicotianae P10297]|uniref:HECT-type E3 ubiquitin transferase n=1 Tax=Phytophthora nicotianae P10297 TaxID=1317064 RepID=W3A4T1_PHYNI|nr:hypothetical protein F442_00716 [Phytophthora nicotianae P10297]